MAQIVRCGVPSRLAAARRPAGLLLAHTAHALRSVRGASTSDKSAPETVEAGWLWQSGGKPGGSSATRVNLRDSGIKAKK